MSLVGRCGEKRREINYFFFNDTATTEIYTLSLHDALPIYDSPESRPSPRLWTARQTLLAMIAVPVLLIAGLLCGFLAPRSEEHTSELQSRQYLVCRLLLEKKKKLTTPSP